MLETEAEQVKEWLDKLPVGRLSSRKTKAAIRSHPWYARKKIARELYLRGRSYEEIGEIIGTKLDPSKPAFRQEVYAFLGKLSPYERQLHEKGRKELETNQKIRRLCNKFGVSRDDLEKAVNPNYQHTDVRRISELSGYPHRLISKYLKLTSRRVLPTKEADLLELRLLYTTGVGVSVEIRGRSRGGYGYDISSEVMQAHSNHTARLLQRLSHRWGSYPDALRQVGIDPTDVYYRTTQNVVA